MDTVGQRSSAQLTGTWHTHSAGAMYYCALMRADGAVCRCVCVFVMRDNMRSEEWRVKRHTARD